VKKGKKQKSKAGKQIEKALKKKFKGAIAKFRKKKG